MTGSAPDICEPARADQLGDRLEQLPVQRLGIKFVRQGLVVVTGYRVVGSSNPLSPCLVSGDHTTMVPFGGSRCERERHVALALP